LWKNFENGDPDGVTCIYFDSMHPNHTITNWFFLDTRPIYKRRPHKHTDTISINTLPPLWGHASLMRQLFMARWPWVTAYKARIIIALLNCEVTRTSHDSTHLRRTLVVFHAISTAAHSIEIFRSNSDHPSFLQLFCKAQATSCNSWIGLGRVQHPPLYR
jgi:hypothetical protein